MKCCICFFGATRQVHYTHKNIEEFIVEPLRKYFDVKIFIHTWADDDSFKLLNPDYYRTSDQSTTPFHTPELEKRWGHMREKMTYAIYRSLETLSYQLYSLKCVTKLMLSKVPSPDLIIFMRQDEKFISFPTVPKLVSLFSSTNQVVTPAFGNWYLHPKTLDGAVTKAGDSGSNDRFAVFNNVKTAEIYGMRYDKVLQYAETRFPHAETFLEYILKKNKIEIIRRKDIKFNLVRPGGVLKEERFP